MGFTDRQSEQASQSICDKTQNEVTPFGTDADTQKKKDLLTRVQSELNNRPDIRTETDLWNLVAATCSLQWRTAKETLDAAERAFQEQHDPDNIPLGLVGYALEGENLNAVRNKLSLSLAQFTLVNETLRQREDLNELLGLLVLPRPAQTQKQEASVLSNAWDCAVPVKKTGSGLLNRMFRLAADKLQKNKPPQPKTNRALSLDMASH